MRGPGHSRSPGWCRCMHSVRFCPYFIIICMCISSTKSAKWNCSFFCAKMCPNGEIVGVRSWPWCQKIPPSPVLLRLLLGKNPAHVPASRRWRTDKEHPHLPKTSTEDTWRNDWQYLTVIQTKHQRSMLIYLKAWKNRSHKKEWWSLKPVPLLDLCGGLPKNPILHAAWEQMRKPIWPPGPVNWSACATCKIYCNHAPKAINLLGESVRIHHHHRLLVNLMVKGGSCLIQTF